MAGTVARIRGGEVSRSGERRGLTHRQRNMLTAYLFISPAIVGVCVFMIYPLVSSFYHAFTKWDGLSAAKWTGLDNFRYMFEKDPTFWPSLPLLRMIVGRRASSFAGFMNQPGSVPLS